MRRPRSIGCPLRLVSVCERRDLWMLSYDSVAKTIGVWELFTYSHPKTSACPAPVFINVLRSAKTNHACSSRRKCGQVASGSLVSSLDSDGIDCACVLSIPDPIHAEYSGDRCIQASLG